MAGWPTVKYVSNIASKRLTYTTIKWRAYEYYDEGAAKRALTKLMLRVEGRSPPDHAHSYDIAILRRVRV
jgi:hypothetical protein